VHIYRVIRLAQDHFTALNRLKKSRSYRAQGPILKFCNKFADCENTSVLIIEFFPRLQTNVRLGKMSSKAFVIRKHLHQISYRSMHFPTHFSHFYGNWFNITWKKTAVLHEKLQITGVSSPPHTYATLNLLASLIVLTITTLKIGFRTKQTI
jgi:hypothetical protein